MKKLIVSLLLLGSTSLAGVAHAQSYVYDYELQKLPVGQRVTFVETDNFTLSPNTQRINEGVIGNASLFERGLIKVYYTHSDEDWRWERNRWQRWCDNNPRSCARQKEQWRRDWRFCQKYPEANACYERKSHWYWGNYR